jgi:hypothetical protein
MMWFTKIAAQVVNDSITKVQVRIQGLEGNGCDLVFYSAGPLLFQILDVTRGLVTLIFIAILELSYCIGQ